MAEENPGKEEIREFLKILRPENIENVLNALYDDAQCDEMECVINQDSDEWKSVFKNAKLVVAQQRKLLSEVNKLRKSNKMDPLSMKDSVWNNTSKVIFSQKDWEVLKNFLLIISNDSIQAQYKNTSM
ncbi:hypothetical protein RFI_18243 [Reticulomyxa filosa]|uniref:Uncharacterized protein n=1 Tax=Reticulomyxa filosa TaxID=46433 RepID=X6N0Z4_RETFI|nr:hypothetical protein RFI_18243 [Reticulomyxa filosa]|eukprot:ETO18997.1 hypothetical protein RFI_18243 [Reticulomyxa filosa]